MFNFTKKSIIFDFLNQSKNDCQNFIKNIKGFVRDEQWLPVLTCDGIVNPTLNHKLNQYIEELSDKNITIEYIEKIMLEIRSEIENLSLKLSNCNSTIAEQYFTCRHIYALYGFIETITEGSILTEAILNRFKSKYGKNYLDVLKRIDNLKPSVLTGFEKIEDYIIDENSDEIKLYLLMKKWQDDQHVFHENKLIERHNLMKNKFEDFARDKYPVLNDVKGLQLYTLFLVLECPILEVENLEKFLNLSFYKKLAMVVGGKNLGLALLDFKGVNIPLTFVVPTSSAKSKAYVSELNNIPNFKYAVRSSATVEDNENQSFAGLFISKLNVDLQEIAKAGDEVYNSCYSDRVKSYVKKFGTNEPEMSIVIQKFKEPEISGVWMGNSMDSGHLEWTNGNGEKLVSGRVQPKYEYWDKNNRLKDAAKFKTGYIGLECLKNQNIIGQICDFEFCVLNNELIFVQCRPVTKTFSTQENIKNKDCDFSGIPASNGNIEGHPKYLEEPSDFKQGDILLTDYTDPEWVPTMMKASAILTAEGGFLSHTAIISRELGIPCITGLGYDAIEKISEAEIILVNGSSGEIKIIK